MNSRKYRLTENDVKNMVYGTAKKILSNKRLREDIMREISQEKKSVNEGYTFPMPGFPSTRLPIGRRMPGMPPMGGGFNPRSMVKYMMIKQMIDKYLAELDAYYHNGGQSSSSGGTAPNTGSGNGSGAGSGAGAGAGAGSSKGNRARRSGGARRGGGAKRKSPVEPKPTTPVSPQPTEPKPTAPVSPQPTEPKPIQRTPEPPVYRDNGGQGGAGSQGAGGGMGGGSSSSSNPINIGGSMNNLGGKITVGNEDNSTRVDNSVRNSNNTYNNSQTIKNDNSQNMFNFKGGNHYNRQSNRVTTSRNMWPGRPPRGRGMHAAPSPGRRGGGMHGY